MPADVKEKVPVVIEAVSNDPDIVALYAFGSLSDNALRPLSDLDFGVLLSCRLEKKQRFEKHLELIGLFTSTLRTEEIDLVVLNDAPARFSFHITNSGTILYCRDRSALIDFIEMTRMLYLDFKPFRESFDREFLQGIGYHGRANQGAP
ncbi:MAG: nucleotidyltransferase domain-containing protein [Desulfobacterales bacterium]|nr:nucleotidyltransferase domain-containing protein [Desulfobacterales bacterium]